MGTLSKRAQRKTAKQKLKAQTTLQARESSKRACRHLHQWPVFLKAEVIMVYLALPDEANLQGVISTAQAQGKTLVVPFVDWKKMVMTPVELPPGDVPMACNDFGLRQPLETTPFPKQAIDLVMVPGLAFDRRGNRLGRGGGFYDRFLSHFAGETCGFAFGFQILNDLAVEPHDRPVNYLVTEKGFETLEAGKTGK